MRAFFVVLAIIPFFFGSSAPSEMPCADKTWYARNIWDMIVYEGQVFVGCGDSVSNAGPINIWAYSPETGWKSEFTVDEEQIDRFTILNGVLTVPGYDSRDNWTFGNYYQRINGAWTKIRNIPDGVHIFDIVQWHELWVATLGVTLPGLTIAISPDEGESWEPLVVPSGSPEYPLNIDCHAWNGEWITGRVMRAYELFSIGDSLYANTDPINSFGCVNGANQAHTLGYIARLDDIGFVQADIDLFNGLSADRITRAVNYDNQTVYLAAETVNSGKWKPLALLSVDDALDARQIGLSDCERPQDIDTLDGALYVLCNHETGSTWQVSVRTTCDLETWEEGESIEVPTFARSFALAPDAVYVGLGGDTDASRTARDAVGQVLTIPRSTAQICPASA